MNNLIQLVVSCSKIVPKRMISIYQIKYKKYKIIEKMICVFLNMTLQADILLLAILMEMMKPVQDLASNNQFKPS
jgi:hypothetical protein